jgi:FkbM family methyltransferase
MATAERLRRLLGRGDARPGAGASDYRIAFRRLDLEGDVFFLPAYALHRPAVGEMLAGRRYEPSTHVLMERLLRDRPGDLIHAGTFFGDMLPSFSRACRGTVLAFEPVLENYVLAKLCVQENGLANVVMVNAGLAEEVGTARIDTGDERHRGGTSEIAETGQPTALLPIDALARGPVAVVQLDVEGHERAALRGAERTLAAHGPVVLIEDNRRDCAPFLEGLGYLHRGAVPGLDAWSLPRDEAAVTRALAGLSSDDG